MDVEPIPQKITDIKISDTVQLPGLEDEYIHVNAEKDTLSNYFAQLAQLGGRDPETARRFFDEKVDIGIGSRKDIHIYKQSELGFKDDPAVLERLDSVTSSIFRFLRLSGDLLAAVSPEPNGRYRMTFNTQLIARNLSRGLPHTGKPDNYSSLPPGAKITYFRDTMKSILTHESTHLIQCMEDPELFKYTAREKVQARALPLFIMSSVSTMALPFELQKIVAPVVIIGGGLTMIGGMVYLDKSGKYQRVQHEAFESQEDKSNTELSNPFQFTVESDPKPSASNNF